MDDELKMAAEEAFPGEWSDDRLAALKELIRMCGSSYDGDEAPDSGDDSHKSTLALLFGKPKK